ncbi:ArnT family glycosyltransferase [Methanobacterium ferruginis]|uniref:ArnT family glycosyltransferase n=1 Tax=Methanobacterium ferruginis TaxID=710191 RepID=UPI002573F0C5|nr:glycosyltransferase family 39 protein [Methanobacterium ferruginis]BDZ69204.1 hypothetical protein GCM10025860_26520 [Methanobacterium ferruginis]
MVDITISSTGISSSQTGIMKFLKEKYWLILLIVIFLFSFILDLFVLTRYPLSYGIDGAFYDIQVRNILQYGFPMSNDPPLAYYLLTPFVTLSGNSFLGVKIGMAFMGSLLVFLAFFLTECYVKEKNGKKVGSRIPALLSAFMVTVNINYFALIGDYMQNLVGVLFLSIFLYFAIRWFEDIKDWKKYGTLTVLLLGVNLLTHIYTGALAVTLFFGLLIFSIILKTYKTGKLPLFDLKILGILSVGVVVCFLVLFLAYPVMYTKYDTVLSFFNSSYVEMGGGMSSEVSGLIFCSLPYLLGVASAIIILYWGLKEKISIADSAIANSLTTNRNTLLAWVYITLAAVLAVLVFASSSQYQSRFLLISFLPIGLLVPLGLKFIETEFLTRYPSRKIPTNLIIIAVAMIFAFSCYYTASESFNNLGPTITTDEYNELQDVKESFTNVSSQNIVIVTSDLQNKYWVEYVLGDMGTDNNITVVENVQGLQGEYQNSTIYSISFQGNQTSSSASSADSNKISSTLGSNTGNMAVNGNNQGNMAGSDLNTNYNLSFLLPYGPPILPYSLDKIPTANQGSQSAQNSMSKDNQHPGNTTNNTNGFPGNMNPTTSGSLDNRTGNSNMQPPGASTNNTIPNQGASGNNMDAGSGGQSVETFESLTSSGTTIFSGKYFEIIRIEI